MTCWYGPVSAKNPGRFVLVIDRLSIGTEMKTDVYWSDNSTPENPSPVSSVRVERTLFFPGSSQSFSGVSKYGAPVFVPTPMMHSSTTKSLIYDADISIWNNEANDPVAYGHVRSTVSSSFIPVVTMGTWNRIIHGFVNAFFDKTLFSGSSE